MCDICYLFGFRRKNLREGVRNTSVNGKGTRIILGQPHKKRCGRKEPSGAEAVRAKGAKGAGYLVDE
jgi:hypothetical protein